MLIVIVGASSGSAQPIDKSRCINDGCMVSAENDRSGFVFICAISSPFWIAISIVNFAVHCLLGVFCQIKFHVPKLPCVNTIVAHLTDSCASKGSFEKIL